MPGAQTDTQRAAAYKDAGVAQPYTTKQVGSNYEVYQGANRLGTGTKEYADSYLTRNKAAEVTAKTGTGTPAATPYVSDSSSIVAGEHDTMNGLNSLFGQTSDVKNLLQQSQSSIAEITGYQDALAQRRIDEEASIRKDYAQQTADTQGAQESESGSTNTAITTKLGGYLGSSGSAVGVMNNLAASHRTELLKLDSARDKAIQEARNAITDKEFAVARMKSDEIKSLTNTIYQRQQDFFDNALKLSANNRAESAETRAQEDQKVENIKNLLEGIKDTAGSGMEATIDPKKAREIDAYYGVPGFTANYADAQRSAAVAKTKADKIDSMQKYVNLIESVPAGTKIPIGNEIVTGIGKVSDISSYKVEDKYGNVRIVAFNQGSGEYSVTNVGAIGTPSSTGTGASEDDKQTALTTTMQAISNAKDQDGNPIMDPNSGKILNGDAYLQIVSGVEKRYPGTKNFVNDKFLSVTGDNRYFDQPQVLELRQKAGLGVGYGAQ